MSILNPIETVKIDGVDVTFRELRAVEGIEFLKRLSKYASQLRVASSGEVVSSLIDIVSGAEDVAKYLVLRSAQKDESWFDQISTSGFVDALQASINLNITESIVKKVMGVKASIAGTMTLTQPNETLPVRSSS